MRAGNGTASIRIPKFSRVTVVYQRCVKKIDAAAQEPTEQGRWPADVQPGVYNPESRGHYFLCVYGDLHASDSAGECCCSGDELCL